MHQIFRVYIVLIHDKCHTYNTTHKGSRCREEWSKGLREGSEMSWQTGATQDSGWQSGQRAALGEQHAGPRSSHRHAGRGGHGGGSGGSRGRGRGQGRGGGEAGSSSSHAGSSSGHPGHLQCDYIFSLEAGEALAGSRCTWRTSSSLSLTLHKSDRHLIYPSGGIEALKRIDPMLIEEEKDRKRKARKGWNDDEETQMALLQVLNVDLSTPDMMEKWISERKKRWPTREAVERKKIEDEWLGKSAPKSAVGRRDERYTHRDKRRRVEAQEESPPIRPPESGATDAQEAADDEDSDGPVEEVSSKPPEGIEIPHDAAEPDETANPPRFMPAPANLCEFWAKGRCRFGDKCRKAHPPEFASEQQQQQSASDPNGFQQRSKPRPRPRLPPPNPFEQPDLLRQLLAREIDQHVDATIQCIRFLSKNDWLTNVELQIGAAEQQKKRRGRIEELDTSEASGPSLTREQGEDGAPVTVASLTQPGARSLYRPPSPTLRPLVDLQWPPEPDALIYLDPLRRDDPKPLKPSQLEQFALDPQVRQILSPAHDLHPHGHLNKAFTRGLDSLLELPTEAHRMSAIELCLGVADSSPLHPHHIAPGARPTTNNDTGPNRRRKYNETELFRCGLRIGPEEVPLVRRLAERVSAIMGGTVDYDVSHTAGDHLAQQEQAWRAEADRLDQLRKLGIDVD